MPSDSVVSGFFAGLKTPEFVLVIGILAILAYVVVKALPMVKELKLKQIERQTEIECMRLENEQRREERKAEEFQKELEISRARTEVIGKQNEILASLERTAASQTLSMTGLAASIEESKVRSRTMGDTIKDTNSKVSEIHTMIVKSHK